MAEKTEKDFGGDAVAFAKYQEEQVALKASKSSPKAGKVSPAKVEVKGILNVVSQEAIKFRSGSTGRFLRVAGKQILISEALYQRDAKYLVEGTDVTLECEERIADVTGYEDTNPASKTVGEWKKHTSSGLGYQSVVSANEENAINKASLSVAKQVSVEAREQMMKGVIKAIGDDKGALSVALAGAFAGL